jgi:hypothetical protein
MPPSRSKNGCAASRCGGWGQIAEGRRATERAIRLRPNSAVGRTAFRAVAEPPTATLSRSRRLRAATANRSEAAADPHRARGRVEGSREEPRRRASRRGRGSFYSSYICARALGDRSRSAGWLAARQAGARAHAGALGRLPPRAKSFSQERAGREAAARAALVVSCSGAGAVRRRNSDRTVAGRLSPGRLLPRGAARFGCPPGRLPPGCTTSGEGWLAAAAEKGPPRRRDERNARRRLGGLPVMPRVRNLSETKPASANPRRGGACAALATC